MMNLKVMAILLTLSSLTVVSILVYITNVHKNLKRYKYSVELSKEKLNHFLIQKTDELIAIIPLIKEYLVEDQLIKEDIQKAKNIFLNENKISRKIDANHQINQIVQVLLEAAKKCPNQKFSEDILTFQSRINIEENNAVSEYNKNVALYNNHRGSFKNIFVSNLYKYKDEKFFRITPMMHQTIEIDTFRISTLLDEARHQEGRNWNCLNFFMAMNALLLTLFITTKGKEFRIIILIYSFLMVILMILGYFRGEYLERKFRTDARRLEDDYLIMHYKNYPLLRVFPCSRDNGTTEPYPGYKPYAGPYFYNNFRAYRTARLILISSLVLWLIILFCWIFSLIEV